MNKSNLAVNTATLSLTIDYCDGKLKYRPNLNPDKMPPGQMPPAVKSPPG